MNLYFFVAAILLVFLGGTHSLVGERALLVRLLRHPDLPELFGDVFYTRRIIRFAWHLASLCWVGMEESFFSSVKSFGSYESSCRSDYQWHLFTEFHGLTVRGPW